MSTEVLQGLRESVVAYDGEAAARWAARAVAEKVDPGKAIDTLMEVINEIGRGFADGEFWLPDLMGAAEAMKGAMPVLEEEIRTRGEQRKAKGSVVLGTVQGDIHDIGKSIVGTCLAAGGFRVHDLGVNVPGGKFLEAVQEHKADILAMSSLLSTTAPEQSRVVGALRDCGLRDQVKVMVGGGAITREFADSIGADGYESSGLAAVGLATTLMENK